MLSTQYIRSVQLVNFRKYAKAEVEFGEKLNIITGPNGAGKTNLLDALYYSCFSKSYFSGQDHLVFSFGADFFRLYTEIIQNSDLHTVEIKNIKSGKKEVMLDGVPIERLSDFVGKFPAVFITPDDNQLLLGSSEIRRKLVDSTLCQVNEEYLDNLLKYNRLLSQRNALLKLIAETGRVDIDLLNAYNERLAPLGQAIYQARVQFNEQFAKAFNRAYQQIFSGKESVSITYESVINNTDFQSVINKNIKVDMAAQRTTAGIHTDDWVFELNGFPVKKTGSQGQQKTFLLALKLAQYDHISRARQIRPFLFLDDIFDKLDRHRTAQLINLVSTDAFGQVFITDTDKERIRHILDDNQITGCKHIELLKDAQ